MAAASKAQIREKVLVKLGITSASLSNKISKLAQREAVSNEVALYIIAQQNGVPINRIDPTLLAQVREHLAKSGGTAPPPVRRAATPAPRAPREVILKIGPLDFDATPCLSAKMVQDAQKTAQESYSRIFLIENSARELIRRVMHDAYGKDWWTKEVDATLQKKADRYSKNELKEAWHPPRGKDPTQFIDLPDLADIVDAHWTKFEPIFKKENWFRNFIDELNVTRRAVAHMNVLDSAAVKYVDVYFVKWTKLLQARSAEIPA